ncbi:MAG: aldolase/citrate lyase family protein [Bdellovibrionota bacterium]
MHQVNVSLKARLSSTNSNPVVGSWISLAHTGVAEIMARAGFDFLVLDLEHSSMSLAQAEDMIRVIGLHGTPVLARLSSHDWAQAKRVMDMGATGVIVPMINSAEQAKAAVSAVYYPPRGTRGMGLARAQGYGTRFEEYRVWSANETVVIAQIEHVDGVRNMESIMKVDGVDGYIVGPYDLSSSMNLAGQFDAPLVKEALATIREIGKKSGKPGGLHLVEPDEVKLKALIDEGNRFIAYGVDFRMLDVAARKGAAHSLTSKERGRG